MRILITIIFICLFFRSIEKISAQCAKIDLVFLIDVSSSVRGNEPHIIKALQSFSDRFELSEEGIKLSIIVFSSESRVLLPLTNDKTLLNRVFPYISCDGSTDMSEALQSLMLELEKNGREDVMKLVVVISDGDVDSPSESLEMITLIKQLSINICSVFINGDNGNRTFMRNISTNSCYYESNYEGLFSVLKELDVCI